MRVQGCHFICSLAETKQKQIVTPAQLGTLNKLCNVFHKRRPPKPSPFPTWDIGLVLHALLLAPFEPLNTTSLEDITYKTFVLIALALGDLRGELCTLRRGQFVRSEKAGLLCCYILIRRLFPKGPRKNSLQSRINSGHSRLAPLPEMTPQSCAQ